MFGDSGFLDSQGVAGTSDVTLDFDPGLMDDLLEAGLEQGARPYEGVPGVRVLDAAAAPQPPPPPPAPPEDSVIQSSGVPWCFNGHSVVQAPLIAIPGGIEVQPSDVVLFCKSCGASMFRNVRSGEGLDGPCQGPSAPGLRTQRSRLRRGLFPGRQAARIGSAAGPTASQVSARTPRLASLKAATAEAADVGGEARPATAPPLRPPRYGLTLPRLLDFDVARMHGFDSPTKVVEFAQWYKPSPAELPFEEECDLTV